MPHADRTWRSFFIALFLAALCSPLAADERTDKILANLKLQFPQLANLNVQMGAIEATEWPGLEKGSFSIQGQPQPQHFLVNADDTKLYLISGDALDVSKTQAEVASEVAELEAAKAREATERHQELAEAVSGLPIRGNPDAPVTIVEFSDFQCPYCARGYETMEKILDKYPNDVKFVFMHFPLNFHPWAKPAAIASHCAGKQSPDAFWTLHDKYFEHQKDITPQNVVEKSKEYLADSGLDMERWSLCAESSDSEPFKAASAKVDADMAFGSKLGVRGTPGFFVNGQFLNGAQPIAAFEPLIAAAKGSSGGAAGD